MVERHVYNRTALCIRVDVIYSKHERPSWSRSGYWAMCLHDRWNSILILPSKYFIVNLLKRLWCVLILPSLVCIWCYMCGRYWRNVFIQTCPIYSSIDMRAGYNIVYNWIHPIRINNNCVVYLFFISLLSS